MLEDFKSPALLARYSVRRLGQPASRTLLHEVGRRRDGEPFGAQDVLEEMFVCRAYDDEDALRLSPLRRATDEIGHVAIAYDCVHG